VNTANYTTGWMKTFFILLYMKEGAANAWAKEYQVSRDYSTTDYTTANFDEHPANAPARHRPTFMEYLKLQFVDPLERQEAQQKLPLLKMTDETGQMFIAKLNTLFQQAGIIDDRINLCTMDNPIPPHRPRTLHGRRMEERNTTLICTNNYYD
jgi:hypothetical protein